MEAVMQFVTAPSTSPDPFDALPIEMPLESQELFHYCTLQPGECRFMLVVNLEFH